ENSNSYMKLYDAITWHNIKKYLPNDRNSLVLDAGGGTGRWAIPIAKLSYKVVMVDISKGMLEVARKKIERMNLKNIKFVRMDIREMAFEDETFDFVLAEGDPVSYCGDPEIALSEIFRVLKRGCFACISVDSKFSMALKFLLKGRMEELEGFLETGKTLFPSNTKDGFETRAFALRELRVLFEKVGFETVSIIGKPLFSRFIERGTLEELLKDEKSFEKILDLELTYCKEESLVGFGGHLEAVGRKR
ncbi:MAG: class I SAM-dependent methyltransferase, partial [Candidatus Methanofastidiosia archaeon]